MFGSRRLSVYRGMTACGIPAYTISGNHIYDGMTACGIPAFTLD